MTSFNDYLKQIYGDKIPDKVPDKMLDNFVKNANEKANIKNLGKSIDQK